MLRSRETGVQVSRAGVIARLSGGQEQPHRLAGAVADGVQLRIQTAFRPANTAGERLFLSRLAAVLGAFRCVASSIR